MWKCKKCGNKTFYQPIRTHLNIYSIDKTGEVFIDYEYSSCEKQGKIYCDNCKKNGWKIQDIAEWEEENERD